MKLCDQFMSLTDSNEKRVMHITSDNTKVMIDEDTDEIIEKLLDLLLRRYQTGPEQSMKGTNSVFDYVDGLDYRSVIR